MVKLLARRRPVEHRNIAMHDLPHLSFISSIGIQFLDDDLTVGDRPRAVLVSGQISPRHRQRLARLVFAWVIDAKISNEQKIVAGNQVRAALEHPEYVDISDRDEPIVLPVSKISPSFQHREIELAADHMAA